MELQISFWIDIVLLQSEYKSAITAVPWGVPLLFVIHIIFIFFLHCLFTQLTHDCAANYSPYYIIKFADDTTVVRFSNNDESAYREKIDWLAEWCRNNNLSFNVDKTKQRVVNLRRSHWSMEQLWKQLWSKVSEISVVHMTEINCIQCVDIYVLSM